MKRQKVCIIGGSLAGLTTAISLSKLNCEIDLITSDSGTNQETGRTLAVSDSNLKFLNELNISKYLKKYVWPCSKMQLYTDIKNEKFVKIFELTKNKKKIFYTCLKIQN